MVGAGAWILTLNGVMVAAVAVMAGAVAELVWLLWRRGS
jgi:hypothetical protein